ncbi:MAG: hypothetical protein KJP11_10070 [Gammaproteobacteria bacterium]|nr:hypothetical protein [Gammaproteobacteria bacterium]
MASIQPALALELFGVNLQSTNRSELRSAVKAAGVILIREGGKENWFDVYDSSRALAGSSRLYLGFVKQDLRFAFAEYEFGSLISSQLLSKLSAKYGAAEILSGSFISDRKYRWQRDGIDIELSSDWRNHKSRLSYINPVNMADLLAERSAHSARAEANAGEISFY